MRTLRPLGVGLSVVLVAGGALRAQFLELDVVGGSMPGTLAMDVYPAVQPVELVIIIPSTNTGPTPIAWFAPLDPRSFDVGLDLLSLMFVGLTGVDGHFRFSMPIVFEPSFVDTALYLQAATVPFTPVLIDRISNSNAFRWASAGAFRDRGVFFANSRAFATVLPRTDRRWMVTAGGQGLLLAQVATSTSEIYDPITDSFSAGPSLTTPRSLHTSTQLPDGTWLIAGGVNASNDPQPSCEIYDPVADTFTAVASMNVPRTGHTATLLGNGKVLVTGGLLAMTVTPTQLSAIHDINNLTELYDPATDTWTPGPNMTTPRAGHIAITRPDGKVLLAGGISWDNIIITWLPAVRRSCDLYDPVANTIAAGPQMATARSLIDPVDLGSNRWLLAGGISAVTLSNPGTPTATAEIYNAVANTWTTVGSMATARGNHKGWALNGTQFLLAGGANGSITSPTALSSTEIFSTTTNTFSAGPALTSARAGAAAFLTPQGQMQLFGGATAGGSISATTEWYFLLSHQHPLLARLAATVRSLRKSRGWSRRDLAEKTGISERFLADVEGGQANPSVLRLVALAEAFEVTAPALLGGDAALPPRHVALLGLRGAGKSTIGPLLARRLGCAFVELDACIEAATGLQLGEIFQMHGEAYFRATERRVLGKELASEPSVLAVGGGIVTDPQSFAMLRAGARTVWLRAMPEDHWQRVIAQGDLRPMADNEQAFGDLRRILTERDSLYRQADVVVDTSTRPIEATVELVHRALVGAAAP